MGILFETEMAEPFYESQYALCHAADNGNEERVKELIDSGASTNVQDFLGMTPLLHAANMGQAAIVEILLESNAEPDMSDNAGRTPLMLAAAGGMIGVVEKLLLFKIDEVVVDCAINQKDRINGDTALILAAKHNSAEVVTLLLESGADHKIQNNDGLDALKLAKRGKLKAVTPILENPKSAAAGSTADAENQAKMLNTFKQKQLLNFNSREAALKAYIDEELRRRLGELRDDLERRRADLDAELQQRLLEFEQQLRDKMEEDKRSRTIKMEKERNAQREKLKKEAEETKIREARVREANARLLAEKERRDTLQKQRMAEEQKKITDEYDLRFEKLKAKLEKTMEDQIAQVKEQNDKTFEAEIEAAMETRKVELERKSKRELDDHLKDAFPEMYIMSEN